MSTHSLVVPVLVWVLCIAHHFPQKYSKAPHVTAAGKLAVGNSLRGCPTHWDLTTLEDCKKNVSIIRDKLRYGKKVMVLYTLVLRPKSEEFPLIDLIDLSMLIDLKLVIIGFQP